MILLNEIIEVFDLPEFDHFGKRPTGFEIGNGLGIGRVLVDFDYARN